MADDPNRRRRAALEVLAHAWYATRVQTPGAAEACHADFSRARDFLMHTPAWPMVRGEWQYTERSVSALREEALAEMRARCHACGLCERFGVKPP